MQTIRSLMFHAAAAAAALALACLTPRPAMAQTGMTQIKAGDLPVTLVYPTAAPNRPNTFGPFALDVALGAAPMRGNGRLVVLSHGTGGSPLTDHDLAHALAAAGFVVAQPQHRGDNFRDTSLSGPESWKLRPQEVSRAIDAVLADPRFAPLVDGKRVGVHGMSAGGLTGLALAGGQWSVASVVQHCAAHQVDDAGFCFYGVRNAAEREQRAASYTRATLPEGAQTLLGGATDPRIAAVAVTVPVGAIFTAESLAAIKMPVGIVEATADKVLLPAFHSGRVLAQCGQCRALGAIQGAGHFDVLSPLPALIASQIGANPAFDRALLPESDKRIAAFFQQTLGND
jgi:predicted dienelactone hydrolase